MSQRWLGYRLVMGVGLMVLALGAEAQPQRTADPLRFLKWLPQDAVGLARGVATPRTLYAAGAGGVLIFASRYDESLTERAARIADGPVLRVVEEFGNVRAVRPAAVVLFVGALMSGKERAQDAAFTSLEAIIFSNLMTNSLKSVFGRARPWQGQGASNFKPFSGNSSFPSGHSTTVFAFITPWVLYYPHPITYGLFGLAAATAFSRLATNVHWFTDVIAGSAIGFLTGYWLTHRHQRTGRGPVVLSPELGYNSIGLRLQF